MALLTYDDIQSALNIDLTDPNDQTTATALIEAAVKYAEGIISFPLEESEVTEYFNERQQRLSLNTAAPVTNLTIHRDNSITGIYDDINSQYIRYNGYATVYVTSPLPSGFQSVKATYTTGWTSETLPADLKQALIDLVGLKLPEVTNFSSNPDGPNGDDSGSAAGALKKVSSGAYSEKYGPTASDVMWRAKAAQLSRTIGDSVTDSIQEVFARYRKPFAL